MLPYSKKLQILVTSQVALLETQLTRPVREFLRKKLFILNSEYIIKERLGKPVYNVPKFFDLVEKQTPYILLPRGFLAQLTDFLDKEAIGYEVVCRHPQLPSAGYRSTICLTSEQQHMTDNAFAAGQGVLVAPPGSGKTVMGLELIARHDKPALILTHRKQLLDQWVAHIQGHFDLPKKHIGRYSSAYKKLGPNITVGLLQSFARAQDLSELTERFGVIVVDECHHIPAKTFRAVVSQLNAQHIYGLTATPKRKHNDERLIYLYIGDIVSVMQPPAHTKGNELGSIIRTTSLTLPFEWKKDHAELLAKVVCYDTARNQQIVADVRDQIAEGCKTLLLSERKEHLQILELYLREQSGRILIFTGDDSAKQRTEKLQRINKGAYDVLLATGQLLGEGVHIDNIDTLVLAFPFSFEGKLTQYVGRLLHSDGPRRRLIDYHDASVAVLDRQYKQRQRYYKKLGVVESGTA